MLRLEYKNIDQVATIFWVMYHTNYPIVWAYLADTKTQTVEDNTRNVYKGIISTTYTEIKIIIIILT